MSNAWDKSQVISKRLLGDGWVSPDTYCNYFAPLIKGPAVYLFLLHKDFEFNEAMVAYVGMSTRLSQRIATHNILPELKAPGFWPQIWFKPTPKPELRSVEAQYIASFDPPWNIQGKVRGVPLQ